MFQTSTQLQVPFRGEIHAGSRKSELKINDPRISSISGDNNEEESFQLTSFSAKSSSITSRSRMRLLCSKEYSSMNTKRFSSDNSS